MSDSDVIHFAKQWHKAAKNSASPPAISQLDEIINAALAEQPTMNGFKQAVQLDKIGITDPFNW